MNGDGEVNIGTFILMLILILTAGSAGEAVQAVMDYFSSIITRQQAIEMVMAYFSG